MAVFRFQTLLLAVVLFTLVGAHRADEGSVDSTYLTVPQQELVDFAISRFEQQGLDLPDLEFVFHDSLDPCDGHKGRYWHSRGILEMCSLDRVTMLHELAHAWAGTNLTAADMDSFVARHHLDSWNDHEHAWDRRGTEHVAETIAWALMDDPHHVKWVETLPDGTRHVEHRILTIEVDVETLVDNFELLTGMSPIFRDPAEWSVDDDSPVTSPEALRGT